MIDVERLLPLAEAAVDLARDIVRTHAPGVVTAKGDRDPASEVDYAVERAVRDLLREQTPHVGFLGEEEGGESGELFWALDPMDGTVNFLHDLPLCAVALGLVHCGRPMVGVVDLPFLGLRYSAAAGAGAYAGGTRLRTSPARSLREAVVAVGDYAVGDRAEARNRARLAISQRLAGRAERVRMLGSAVIDLTWVAAGSLGASVMLSNKPWETAAGVLLAREAGALVLDREGRPHTLESTSTVAVAPALADELLELLATAPPSMA